MKYMIDPLIGVVRYCGCVFDEVLMVQLFDSRG